MIYVRHQLDPEDPLRVFEPLGHDHPLVQEAHVCQACDQLFHEGDRTVLVPLGPGDDEVAREKALAGNPFNAVAVPLHAACAGVKT